MSASSASRAGWLIAFAGFVLLLIGGPAQAQQFPQLTGRVVDGANLLSAADEAELTSKLEALERSTSRQFVIATVPDLQGYPIEDYGYRLGRQWGIGKGRINNGIILLVAPNERKVRIEVGYGLEHIITDALSSVIISTIIVPAFKQGNYPAGIKAGAEALIEQLQAPPEVAERKVVEARQQQQTQQKSTGGDGSMFPLIFWGLVFFFVVIPMLRGGRRGRPYRRRGGFPVVIWGPGMGGGGRSSGSGGFSGGGFSGGGFSGGGGSFGGGGASGGW